MYFLYDWNISITPVITIEDVLRYLDERGKRFVFSIFGKREEIKLNGTRSAENNTRRHWELSNKF